jgi:hypothetical protein
MDLYSSDELGYVVDWHKQYFHNYEGGGVPSYLTFEQASSKTNFQPVQSSFLHYELVFYGIAKEGNCRPRKASCGLQEPFPAGFIEKAMSSMDEVRSCAI